MPYKHDQNIIRNTAALAANISAGIVLLTIEPIVLKDIFPSSPN